MEPKGYAILGGAANVHAGLASPRPDKVGMDDWALRWASMNGHLDVVQYLISHGAVRATP
jgi:molybdopterin biosynthesis enzyme